MSRSDRLHFDSKINRLSEFYTQRELVYFMTVCEERGLDQPEALDYIYAQTMVNYTTGIDTNPTMKRTLDALIKHMLFGD